MFLQVADALLVDHAPADPMWQTLTLETCRIAQEPARLQNYLGRLHCYVTASGHRASCTAPSRELFCSPPSWSVGFVRFVSLPSGPSQTPPKLPDPSATRSEDRARSRHCEDSGS